MIKLALKNLKTKPLKTAAIILAVALTIAVLFSLLSFDGIVFRHLYTIETASSGECEVKISYRAGGAKIATVSPLNALFGDIEYAVGSVTVYADTGMGGYVRLIGFDADKIETINKIVCLEGSVSELVKNTDNIAVSKSAAKKLGLKIGSAVSLTVLGQTRKFYVAAICDESGYFSDDSPFTFIGTAKGGVSRFFSAELGGVYTEILVKLKNPENIESVIEKIKSLETYSSMNVEPAISYNAIENSAKTYSASVTVSAASVALLLVLALVLTYVLSIEEKRKLISKLKGLGADERQVFTLFLAENSALSFGGMILGLLLSPLVLFVLVKATLSSTVAYTVVGWKLAVSALISFAISLFSGFLPFLLSRKRSVRENIRERAALKKLEAALAIVLSAAALVCAILMFTLPYETRGALGIINIVLIPSAAFTLSPYLASVLSKGVGKSKDPHAVIASKNVQSLKGLKRTVRLLTLGMSVCALLFSAWRITTAVFTDFSKEFEPLVMVKNVPDDAALIENIKGSYGAEFAAPIIWVEGEAYMNGEKRAVTVFGSEFAFDFIEFGFINDKDIVLNRLNEGGYVFLDISSSLLYGIKEGDKITLKVGNSSSEFTCGGIVEQKLFAGAYVIAPRSLLESNLNLAKFDTVMIKSSDVAGTVGELRKNFADKNLFVISALEAYSWQQKALGAVFDLIGVLALVLFVSSALLISFNLYIAQVGRAPQFTRLLQAGYYKSGVLKMQYVEFAILLISSFILSLISSILSIYAMIYGILVFNIYFTFTLNVAPVFITLFSMAALFMIMPIALGFKKRYNIV